MPTLLPHSLFPSLPSLPLPPPPSLSPLSPLLLHLAANLFASGSHDGVVLLWSTSSLSAMKMFNCADGLPKEVVQSTGPPNPNSPMASLVEIKHILVIGEVRALKERK